MHITNLNYKELKDLLDELSERYNSREFIDADPVSIPHQFSKKEDIEISGFLTALISWGQRPVILKNANQLFSWMEFVPHEFIVNAGKKELAIFKKFVHRTFNGTDCIFFLNALHEIYRQGGSLENIFTAAIKKHNGNMAIAISDARDQIFSFDEPGRSAKHFSNPLGNAAAKRINMYLRWMVRRDKKGVDFGIWKKISPSLLYCPLDVHSGRIARELGLLDRKQDDWKAVEELTVNLRKLDKTDPVKYDFALFGLGVNLSLR